MRKKSKFAILLLVLAGIIVFLCWLHSSERVLKVPVLEEVELEVVDVSESDNGLFVVFKNNSDKRIRYWPYDWVLDKKMFGKWMPVKRVVEYFESPAIEPPFLGSGIETEELFLGWKGFYGTLGNGKYRIIAKVYDHNDVLHNVLAEFEVNR